MGISLESANTSRRYVWLLVVLLSPVTAADTSTAATAPPSAATPAAAGATVASLLLPRSGRQLPHSSVNQIPSGDDGLPAAASTPRKALNKGCSGAQRFTLTCLKLDVAALIERMSSAREYQLMPGVSVVRTNGSDADAPAEGVASTPDLVASVARDFPHDAEARVDAYLARRVARYLQTHAISVKLLDADSLAAARHLSHEVFGLPAAEGSQETGRKGGGGLGGKKGGGGQLLLMMMMMKAMMGAGAGGLVFMLAGKALITALLALMLAAIVGLKSLAGGGGKSVTYEIVSKPVYSHEHTHSSEVQHGHGYGHSSYGRSFSVDPVEAINKSASQYDSTGDSSYVPGGIPYYSGASGGQDMAYRAYSSNVDSTRGA